MRKYLLLLFFITGWASTILIAQDHEVRMELSFSLEDSVKTCHVTVKADTMPVKGVDVHFYAKRLYSLLPLGDAVETDEHGMAETVFPRDLPGDTAGNVIVVARIEDDETWGNVATEEKVKWGVIPGSLGESGLFPEEKYYPWERSLSASRSKAPIYLIVSSLLIILAVWGTIGYVIFLIFRIHKSG